MGWVEVHICVAERNGNVLVYRCPYCSYRVQLLPSYKQLAEAEDPYVAHAGSTGEFSVAMKFNFHGDGTLGLD